MKAGWKRQMPRMVAKTVVLSAVLLSVFVAFAVEPAAASATASYSNAQILNLHNRYRSWHGAPPLRWSPKLQRSAQRWANKCTFQHSGYAGLGENLAWNFGSWRSAINAWYEEERLYDYSRHQWSPSIGHFTQIVWKGTRAVGCAYKCQIYVCQYEPAGNVIGYFAQNVGRKRR